MSDETTRKGGAPGAEDPDEALRRLESLGSPTAGGGAGASLPPPAEDFFADAPLAPDPRSLSGARRMSRFRPSGGSYTGRWVARIAAPVVFLVAVIALLGIVVNSGVLGADTQAPAPSPSASASESAVAKTTKKYTVKSGDSLSSIAARFDITIAELEKLNPDMAGSTLRVGQKLTVPAK